MKTNLPLIAASVGGPLLAVLIYVAYAQHEKGTLREYHEAATAYHNYLGAQQAQDDLEDVQFASEWGKKIRDAYRTGGQAGHSLAQAKFETEDQIRRIRRQQDRDRKTLTGPPPPELIRFREAAKRAAMPATLD